MMVLRTALCRSRRELSNEYFLAKFGFDTAENGPSKVWRYGVWVYGPLPHGSTAAISTAEATHQSRMALSRNATAATRARCTTTLFTTSAQPRWMTSRVLANQSDLMTAGGWCIYVSASFERLVLGCIEAVFCN